MWATAKYDLQLSDTEFWSLTFRQLSALLNRYRQAREFTQAQTALIATITANFGMRAPKEPFVVEDFMPKKKVKERSAQEVAEDFQRDFGFIARKFNAQV